MNNACMPVVFGLVISIVLKQMFSVLTLIVVFKDMPPFPCISEHCVSNYSRKDKHAALA